MVRAKTAMQVLMGSMMSSKGRDTRNLDSVVESVGWMLSSCREPNVVERRECR